MKVKCIYQKSYCAITRHYSTEGRPCTEDYANCCWFQERIQDEDYDPLSCNYEHLEPITICKTVSSIEIAPEIIKIGRLVLDPYFVIELWVDYDDGKGFIPEIVHD